MKTSSIQKMGLAVYLLCVWLISTSAIAQAPARRVSLRERNPEFFKTEEARRIGDQIIAYQRCTGGWPKNIDMTRDMSQEELDAVIKEKNRRNDSTIDNNATTSQMTFLARLYRATKDTRYRDAFRAGVEYLLSGQYENGGWPQFWPEKRGYQYHITFNDDAMVNTLTLLRSIMNEQEPYDKGLIDRAMKKRIKKAFDKGIECILATQIVVDGQPTIWCQQYDHITLKPAAARAYELPSYSPQESAHIVALLMSLSHPDARVKASIHGATC